MPGPFQRMAVEVDELHQRLSEAMVCPLQRTSVLLQVLRFRRAIVVNVVFKMADHYVNNLGVSVLC